MPGISGISQPASMATATPSATKAAADASRRFIPVAILRILF